MGLIQHISSAYGACCVNVLTFHLEPTVSPFNNFHKYMLNNWRLLQITSVVSAGLQWYFFVVFHLIKMSRKYVKHIVFFYLFQFLHNYNDLNAEKWLTPHQLLPVTSMMSDSHCTCFENIPSISLEVTAKYFKHDGKVLHRSNQYCLVGCHNVKSCMP